MPTSQKKPETTVLNGATDSDYEQATAEETVYPGWLGYLSGTAYANGFWSAHAGAGKTKGGAAIVEFSETHPNSSIPYIYSGFVAGDPLTVTKLYEGGDYWLLASGTYDKRAILYPHSSGVIANNIASGFAFEAQKQQTTNTVAWGRFTFRGLRD